MSHQIADQVCDLLDGLDVDPHDTDAAGRVLDAVEGYFTPEAAPGTNLFRTVYRIEVLSDIRPPSLPTLDQLDYDIAVGGSSGTVEEISRTQVSRPTMRRLLDEQGTDPDFLFGAADGDAM